MSEQDEIKKTVDEICKRGEQILDAYEEISDRDKANLLPHLEAIKNRQDTTLAILDEIRKDDD